MQGSPFLTGDSNDDPRKLDWGPASRKARSFPFSESGSYYTAAHPYEPKARMPKPWCWARYTDHKWRRAMCEKSGRKSVAELPLKLAEDVVVGTERVVADVVRGTERVVSDVVKGAKNLASGDHLDGVFVHKKTHKDVLKLHGHRHHHHHRGGDGASSSSSSGSSSSSSSESSDEQAEAKASAVSATEAPQTVLVMGAMFPVADLAAERMLADKVGAEAELKVHQSALAKAVAAYPSVWKTHAIGDCAKVGCDVCGGRGAMGKHTSPPKAAQIEDDDDGEEAEKMRVVYAKWKDQQQAALRLNCGNAFEPAAAATVAAPAATALAATALSTCAGGDGWAADTPLISNAEAGELIAQHNAMPLLDEAAMRAQLKSAIIAGKPLSLQFEHSHVARKHAVAIKGRVEAADVQHVHVTLVGRAEPVASGGHNYLFDVGIAPTSATDGPNEAKRGIATRLLKISVDASRANMMPNTMMKQLSAFEVANVPAAAVAATRAKLEQLIGQAISK